ncbi:hypothetical protein [Nostoc sp.]|uniref:hypothetical protein n=1 Tax=Nostoc sp. TaxID=1180 RepID=UPI002FF5A826
MPCQQRSPKGTNNISSTSGGSDRWVTLVLYHNLHPTFRTTLGDALASWLLSRGTTGYNSWRGCALSEAMPQALRLRSVQVSDHRSPRP